MSGYRVEQAHPRGPVDVLGDGGPYTLPQAWRRAMDLAGWPRPGLSSPLEPHILRSPAAPVQAQRALDAAIPREERP